MSAKQRQYQHMRAELAELDKLLSMTPESAVIDRMSLEYRRSQVEAELEANPPPPRWPASAHLAFNGKPIVEGEGVYADFASAAVGAFAKAVTSLAASRRGPLGERGPIRHREDYRLLVTGTSHGSFGFEIEESPEPQATYLPESEVELALGQARGILESLGGNDEDIAEAVDDADDRALDDLRAFLKVLADNDAVCSLSFDNTTFRFRDVGEVQRGFASLGKDNIQEDDIVMVGRFWGFLPQSRRAEFVEDRSHEVLLCQVDRTVDDAEAINHLLGQDMNVTVRSRRVGNSRPRYTIMSFERALTE